MCDLLSQIGKNLIVISVIAGAYPYDSVWLSTVGVIPTAFVALE